ncbi:CheR family methyltransferase [Sulfuricystis multivorans]|uniref:CheR family methyltransferase n=1 Tax=Sulfuricystis multivorans TaxID=2211108 RepID=UPI000F8169ED|nr:CheR family methyltransferase [Sulfuricystis multivorans]
MDYHFTAEDFQRIRSLIHRHAGIALSEAKREMVYSRLSRRLRALGLATFGEYLARLERDRDEWDAFVNALTTNFTTFFREAHHFDVLRRHLRTRQGRPIRIWCAAAATGEEPYSIAITACETFERLDPPVEILASDIDSHALAIAATGRYDNDRTRSLSTERKQRYFVADGEGLRVRDELKRLVRFRRINLMDAHWPVPTPLAALFCRNVMIYFDKATQRRLLERFRPLLGADGLYFAGHAESLLHASDLFQPLGHTVYRPAP